MIFLLPHHLKISGKTLLFTTCLACISELSAAAVFDLTGQTISLNNNSYTSDDTLILNNTTLTTTTDVTLPASLHLVGKATLSPASSQLTLEGPIDGTAALTLNATQSGTISLATPNPNFSGSVIAYGTLRLATESAFPSSSSINLYQTVIDLNGFDSLGTPSFLSNGTLRNNSGRSVTVSTIAAGSTLHVDGSSEVIYTSTIPSVFNKYGPGTLTLMRDYPGAQMFIHEGTIRIGQSSPSYSAFYVSSTATLDLNGFSPPDLVFQGIGTIANNNPSAPVLIYANNSTPHQYPSIYDVPGGNSIGGSGDFIIGTPLSYPSTKVGSGTITLDISKAYNSQWIVNQGTLRLMTNSSLYLSFPSPNTFVINPGGIFDLNGLPSSSVQQITLNGGALLNNNTSHYAVIKSFPILTSPDLSIGGNGNLGLNVFPSISANFTKIGTGSLIMSAAPSAPVALNALAGTILFGPSLPSTPTLIDLSLSTNTSLDLNNNRLIINYAGPSPINTLRQYLASHQLFSSTNDSTSNHLSILAYTEASDLFQLTGSSTAIWSGQSVDSTSILITAALKGDANLDGQITPDDYALLDRSYAQSLPNAHWTDGDFNYDGLITSADYLLLDTAYLSSNPASAPALLAQRDSQFGDAYLSQLLTNLPEPSSLTCLLAGFLLRRRPSQNPT